MNQSQQKIGIMAHPTIDPFVCRFEVNQEILPDKEFNCRSKEMAQGSPLLESLFSLEGVREVLVSGKNLTISRKPLSPEWRELAKQVGAAIRSPLEEGKNPFPSEYWERIEGQEISEREDRRKDHGSSGDPSTDYADIMGKNLDSPLALEVQKVLEDQINPAVASHGGKILLIGVQEKSIYLKMEGGCQGCGMASMTLRQGVEKALKTALPEIEEVIDITDHASGKNPFFEAQ